MEFSIGVYEGPLDLLLSLVKKEEMDIMNIDIHKITRQYLSVVQEKPHLINLKKGGEFLYMASTLMYIKSRTLLPQGPEEELPEEEIFSAEDLKRALQRHSYFEKAAEKLDQRQILGRDIWSCPGLEFSSSDNGAIQAGESFDLFQTFRRMLERINIYKEKLFLPSVSQWIEKIKKYFVQGKTFSFHSMIHPGRDWTNQILLSFLSVLELGKMGIISLNQKGKDISIFTKKTIEPGVLNLKSEAVFQNHSLPHQTPRLRKEMK